MKMHRYGSGKLIIDMSVSFLVFFPLHLYRTSPAKNQDPERQRQNRVSDHVFSSGAYSTEDTLALVLRRLR